MEKKTLPKTLPFLIPSLMGVAIFILIPFIDVVRRSFFSSMGGNFVGLKNYEEVLKNSAFQLAAQNTLKFVGICLPLLLGISLGLALLIRSLGQKSTFFKTSFLLPLAIPTSSVVLLWNLFFAPKGILNGWLFSLFGCSPEDWLNSPYAFSILVFTYLWKNVGYNMILFLAAFSTIPKNLYEAAAIDRSGPIRTFFSITLPNILPSLYAILLLSFVNIFKVFREVYLLAGEYPDQRIYMLQHLFNNWFRDLAMDRLAAGAVLTALFVGILILLLQLLKRGVKRL